ncbi:MAG: ATP-grasp domain-containing protein [Candidatus Heimdallarchaeaceae archaeon]
MKKDKNSFLFWYPKIKNLAIPQPQTMIVKVNVSTLNWYLWLSGETIIPFNFLILKKKCRSMGYPLFLRTDHTSAKHSWKETCFVEKEENLLNNVAKLVEFNLVADIVGLPINAFIIRKYIPMDTLFTAFWGDTPINYELRFFVEDSKVLCWHWYWDIDALRKTTFKPKLKNWEEILIKAQKSITKKEIDMLKHYAELVSENVEGFWSVDFCRAKDKTWYLIDMALGECSWHPKSCIVFKNKVKDKQRR